MRSSTKLLCFFIALFIYSLPSHAKRDFYVLKEISCTEELCYIKKTKSPLSGELKEYDPKGRLYFSIEYKDGVRHGAQKYYYPDGNISTIEYFSHGKLNGYARSFYNDGKIKEEMYYEDGKRENSHRKFFETGALKEETNYSNGKKEGKQKIFYQNSKLKKETFYENNLPIMSYCISPKGNRTICQSN